MTIKFRYFNKSPKEILLSLNNNWLHAEELQKAREIAVDPNVTEEIAEEYLLELENLATIRYNEWKWTL